MTITFEAEVIGRPAGCVYLKIADDFSNESGVHLEFSADYTEEEFPFVMSWYDIEKLIEALNMVKGLHAKLMTTKK